MFRPNQTVQLYSMIGRDKYSRRQFAEGAALPIAVVKLKTGFTRTTVRADSSATRGTADEITVDGVILVDKRATVKNDDVVEIHGATFRVIKTHPRYSVWGRLDHFQVDLQAEPDAI